MTNKEIVKGFFIENYVKYNYDFARQYVSKDYIDHSPCHAHGAEQAIGILKCVENMFSDMKIEILDLIEENNQVAVRLQYTARHTGVCMNIPATNKIISFEALENFRLENGKIVESWGYWPDYYIENFLLGKAQ